MATVGEIVINVRANTSDFRGLSGNLGRQAGNAGGVAGKKFGGGLLAGVKGVAGPMAAVLGAVGAGAFLKDAVSAAGDLEQSVGAIDTVFKDSASQMHKWSKEAAQAVGLSKNEFNELGTLIGTQLKNGGTAMEDLAPKTNELIELGADLSSMFGGTAKTAIEAISSALKGERDPIEKYGVSLKQATIDAKAAELGFKKVGGTFDNNAQQAATIALIMEQSSDAIGNFAKESDTLQGKQQRLRASFDNLKTSIGEKLLPVVAKLVGFLNDKLPIAIEWFKQKLQELQPVLEPIKAEFRKLMAQFQEFWAKHGPMVMKILAGIAAIIGGILLAAIYAMIKYMQFALKVWDAVFSFLEKVDTPKKFADAFVAGLKRIGKAVTDFLLWPFRKAWDFLIQLPQKFYDLGRNIMKGLYNGLKSMGKSVYDATLGPIVDGFKAGLKYLGIHSPSRKYAEMGENSMKGLVKGTASQRSAVINSTVSTVAAAYNAVNNLTPSLNEASVNAGAMAPAGNYTINVSADSEDLVDKIVNALNLSRLASEAAALA